MRRTVIFSIFQGAKTVWTSSVTMPSLAGLGLCTTPEDEKFSISVVFFRISFLPHVYLAPPLGVTPLDFTKTFDIRKLKSQDYCVACLLHLAISIAAGLYTGTQTDRQTDTGHDIHCANIVSHCEHSVIVNSIAGTTVVLKLVVVYLYVASEGPTDKRSILFVGSKDAVSMIQFCCNLIDFIWLCQHLHFISCSEYSESVRS